MALGTWNIDPSHSAIAFAVRHMVVSKTRGRFTKWSGQLRFDEENPVVSSVEVTIDPASIDTADGQRDAHLRSADFLDVEKFPTASFRSTKVEEPDSGRYRITGDLTVHGVTKSVTFDVQPLSPDTKTPFGTTIVGTSATTRINRRDFGITGGTAGVMVGDEVNITLDLELVKQ